MVMGGLMPGDLHVIVSHGKNGSRTEWPNQAGNLPQIQAHHDGVFFRLGIVIRPPRNGPETALLVKRLGGVICAPNLKKCSSCSALTSLVEHLIEQSRADAVSPELGPDRKIVNVQLTCGFSRDDVTRDWRRVQGGRLRRARHEHQFAIRALHFRVICRPAPPAQPRLFFDLNHFEQIVLGHAFDGDLLQRESDSLFGHAS